MTGPQNDFSAERQQKCGQAVMQFDAIAQGWRVSSYELCGFSVRTPRAEGEDFLLTIRALDGEGAPVVAFHNASNLMELWIGAWGRFSNGQLKWKPDNWGR